MQIHYSIPIYVFTPENYIKIVLDSNNRIAREKKCIYIVR